MVNPWLTITGLKHGQQRFVDLWCLTMVVQFDHDTHHGQIQSTMLDHVIQLITIACGEYLNARKKYIKVVYLFKIG